MAVLYVIRSPLGRRKLGYTINLAARMAALEHHNAIGEYLGLVCEMTQPCDDTQAKALEDHIHAQLWLRRVRGEWFWCSLDLARETIFGALLAADIGALIRPPGVIQQDGLWRGEGRFVWPTHEELDAVHKEKHRFQSERRRQSCRERWVRRRQAVT